MLLSGIQTSTINIPLRKGNSNENPNDRYKNAQDGICDAFIAHPGG